MGSTDSRSVWGAFFKCFVIYELKLVLDLFCRMKRIIMFVVERFLLLSFPLFFSEKDQNIMALQHHNHVLSWNR